MQHFRDNEKKQLKMTVSRPFWVLFVPNFSHVLSLCDTFCYICMVQLFCFDFELRKYNRITQIQNGR